jgi:Tfp pilus assembly protein PilN
MIKINLLGKKKSAGGGVPFGLDEQFAKLGINPAELSEMRPALARFGVLLAGIYIANYAPTYYHEMQIKELDAEVAVLTEKANTLNQELATKKDVRKQMEQLNKEELELQRQLNAVNALQRDRSLAFRTIDNIIISLPSKVWIDTIIYKNREVTMRGSCWEYFPINDFVKSINESTQYTEVVFKGITTENPSSLIPGIPEAMQKIKNFDLDFKVKGSGDT